MNRAKILNEFNKMDCIININMLEEYVDFCLSNDVGDKQTKKTTSHHILPQGKTLPFKKFANLNENSWNKTELSYYNHYFAHYLLTQAIDHHSVYSSFCAMHNKDLKLGRIKFQNLIDKEEYEKIYYKRNKKISEDRLQLVEYNGEIMTKASYIGRFITQWNTENKSIRMETNNIINLPGVLEKIRKTKSQTFINGKNIDTISAEKAATTMRQKIVVDGEITTIYQLNAAKLSKTLTTEYINDLGEITTLAKERGKKHSELLQKKGNFYELKNIFDEGFNKKLSAKEIRDISPGLESKTRDNYLGKQKCAITRLTKIGKTNLIGLYVEKLP